MHKRPPGLTASADVFGLAGLTGVVRRRLDLLCDRLHNYRIVPGAMLNADALLPAL